MKELTAMATVLERVPVARINAEAHEVDIPRAALTLVAAVLFAVGWLSGKTVGLVFAALAWSFAAVKVGWSDARRPPLPDGGG
jgi:hypothetical protein